MDAGAKAVIGFVGLVAATLSRGYAMAVLWAWFMVPLGLDPIGKAHALGLSLLVGMLTYGSGTGKSGDEFGIAHALIVGIVHPFVCIGVGWLIRSFM